MSRVHRDETTAQVILTKPRRPNQLEGSLTNLGWRVAQIEPTDEAFIRLATVASERLVVCSPFFDSAGARWLQRLFEATKPGVERILVLRYLSEPGHSNYPSGYPALVPWLTEEHIKVFDYGLRRPDGRSWESFHAKLVLADEQHAYVGSSNLNAASLDYSMEMGALLQGKAAGDVATVVRAVLEVATRVL
jgi:phosphatidylserine/phosphatidylglycerophosphate/cardiolipin synthase-like enzyme